MIFENRVSRKRSVTCRTWSCQPTWIFFHEGQKMKWNDRWRKISDMNDIWKRYWREWMWRMFNQSIHYYWNLRLFLASFTIAFQPLLSCACSWCLPILLRSLSTYSLQQSLGHPRNLLPAGTHTKNARRRYIGSLHKMWLNHMILRLFIYIYDIRIFIYPELLVFFILQ